MAVRKRLMRRRAEGAIGHAELEVDIVPGGAGHSFEVDLVAAAFDAVCDGCDGAVEVGRGCDFYVFAGINFEAGRGVTCDSLVGGEGA